VAAHRTYAPAIHVLDDRIGLAAIGAAPVDGAVQRQRVGAAQRYVVLVAGAQHVVAQVHGAQVARQAGQAALVGSDGAVAGVLGPAQVEDERVGAFAVLGHVILVRARRVLRAQARELVLLEVHAHEDAVVLGNRHAEVQARTDGGVLVIAPGVVGLVGRGAAVVDRGGLADAVARPVRVGVADDGGAVHLA